MTGKNLYLVVLNGKSLSSHHSASAAIDVAHKILGNVEVWLIKPILIDDEDHHLERVWTKAAVTA